ncbi:Ribonuclease VapC43 [subsurface metagenome]
MLLFDVNVLVYAHREDTPNHAVYHDWLERVVNSVQAFGFSDLVSSGFLRIVTHPCFWTVF